MKSQNGQNEGEAQRAHLQDNAFSKWNTVLMYENKFVVCAPCASLWNNQFEIAVFSTKTTNLRENTINRLISKIIFKDLKLIIKQ